MTFGVFIPCSLFLGNIDEFQVDFVAILPIVVLFSLMIILILVVVAVFLPGDNEVEVYFSIIFGCALGLYLQGNFLNPSFNVLNGAEIDWSKYTINGILSIVVWGSCLVIPRVLIKYKEKIDVFFSWISWFFSAIEIVSLIILILTTPKAGKDSFVLTTDGEFEVSDKNNIIIFVVDTLDASWFEDVILTNEIYTDNLLDFTYFDNVVSGGAPTILGIPTLLTGEIYNPSIELSDYYKEAYRNSTLFTDLREHDYDINLYTEYKYLNGADLENIKNIEASQGYFIGSYIGFAKCLYKFTSFYAMPQFLKQYFWFYGGEFEEFISSANRNLYSIDDVEFYRGLKNSGLEVIDSKNIFALYHLFGAHGPYSMNQDCERIEKDLGTTSRNQQIQGVFNIIFTYIDYLKQLGAYENSTIIITGDHGGVDLYQNPAVLIKQKNVSKKFEINSVPGTFGNLYASIAEGFLEDTSSYGESLFAVDNNSEKRIHTASHILGREIFPDNVVVDSKEYTQFAIPPIARDTQDIEVIDDRQKNIIDYALGDMLDFRVESAETQNIVTNLEGVPMESGRWLLGNSCEIEFELSESIDEDLVLNLEYGDVLGGKQTLVVYSNENLIGKNQCKQEDRNKELTFVIPRSSIVDNRIRLKFEMPEALHPSELDPKSNDTRKLSIKLITMQIDTLDVSM